MAGQLWRPRCPGTEVTAGAQGSGGRGVDGTSCAPALKLCPQKLGPACRESDDDEEVFACPACGGTDTEKPTLMLECSKCLGGWHLGCLEPPLSDVPEVGGRCWG